MTNKKRFLALVTAIAVLFIVLFSAAYIVKNSNHDCCAGSDCPICYNVSVCRDMLKTLSVTACILAFAVACTGVFCSVFACCAEFKKSATPVSMKVKLLN